CGYVWHEYIVEKIPPKTFDLILEMLRAFIKDLELGKGKNDAGWIPLSDEKIKDIQKISFCEIDLENISGRVNPNSQIPAEIFMTEEGHIFYDYIKSLKVIEEIWQVSSGSKEEYLIALEMGLKSMFKSAYYFLWEKEKGAIPEDVRSLILSPKWIKVTEDLANLLAERVSEAILQKNDKERENVAPQKRYKHFNFEKLFKNEILKSQWDRIVAYFREHDELIESLGLIWYAINKAAENEIEYEGARIKILEETIKIVASRRRITASDLREKLKGIGENLDELIEKDKWGLNWRDVFTIP
ncbi:MAG: hypothetical protein ABIM44_09330, partial [candidate division WOR-3 bacterium]